MAMKCNSSRCRSLLVPRCFVPQQSFCTVRPGLEQAAGALPLLVDVHVTRPALAAAQLRMAFAFAHQGASLRQVCGAGQQHRSVGGQPTRWPPPSAPQHTLHLILLGVALQVLDGLQRGLRLSGRFLGCAACSLGGLPVRCDGGAHRLCRAGGCCAGTADGFKDAVASRHPHGQHQDDGLEEQLLHGVLQCQAVGVAPRLHRQGCRLQRGRGCLLH